MIRWSRWSRWSRCAVFGLSLAVTTGVALEARAEDPPEVVQARQDFREGVSLMAAEDWAGALAKFQRVARVKVNAQVAFNMAECEEHLGKWVSALGNYRLASAKAADGSAPEVASHVDERIASLEKRIPHLAIKKKEPTPNPKAHVELDGVEVQPTQLDKPMSVDPGDRVVTVVVAGKTVGTKKVTLAEGKSESVEMVIPAPIETSGGGGGEPGTARPSGPSVPGIVLSTIGAATTVVGLVFIGLRQKAIGDLDTLCGGDNSCPPSAQSTYDEGRTFTGVAEITIPVGVVALTTGIVLIATKKSPKPADTAPKTGWMVVPAAPRADAGLSALAVF
jgi:hypothetical protein